MKIRFDENGYVEGYAIIGGIGGGVEYSGEVPADFEENFRAYRLIDGALVFDPAKLDALQDAEALSAELCMQYEWFEWYDNQVMQYERAARLNDVTGTIFDGDIHALDREAKDRQTRIREIRGILNC